MNIQDEINNMKVKIESILKDIEYLKKILTEQSEEETNNGRYENSNI